MKDEFKHSDSRASQKLSDLKMTPPPGAWDSISKGIKPRRKAGWIWFSLIAILFIEGTAVVLNSTSEDATDQNKNSIIAQNKGGSELQSKSSVNDSNNSNAHKSENKSANTTESNRENQSSSEDSSLKSTQKQIDSDSKKDSHKKKTTVDDLGVKKNNDGGKTIDSSSDKKSKDAKSKDKSTTKKDKSITTKSADKHTIAKDPSSHEPIARRLDLLPFSPFTWTASDDRSAWFMSLPGVIRRPKFSVEAGMGIGSFSISPSRDTDTALQQYVKNGNTNKIGYSTFLNGNYHINSKWSVYAGLEYSVLENDAAAFGWNSTIVTSYDTTGWYFDTVQQQQFPIIDTNVIYGMESFDTTIQNKTTLISIPFGFTYSKSLGTRSTLALSAGGSFTFSAKSTGMALNHTNLQQFTSTAGYRQKNLLDARLALRYSYTINQRTILFTEPWIGIGITNYSQNVLSYKSRLNTAGIRLGLRVNL